MFNSTLSVIGLCCFFQMVLTSELADEVDCLPCVDGCHPVCWRPGYNQNSQLEQSSSLLPVFKLRHWFFSPLPLDSDWKTYYWLFLGFSQPTANLQTSHPLQAIPYNIFVSNLIVYHLSPVHICSLENPRVMHHPTLLMHIPFSRSPSLPTCPYFHIRDSVKECYQWTNQQPVEATCGLTSISLLQI